MTANREQDPFSIAEWLTASAAVAAVALPAFFAFQDVSLPLKEAGPPNTTQPPALAAPEAAASEPSANVSRRHRHGPVLTARTTGAASERATAGEPESSGGPATEGQPVPGREKAEEAAAPDFPRTAAPAATAKWQAPATAAQPAPVIAPIDLFRMREDIAAQFPAPAGEVPTPTPASSGAVRDPSNRSDALWIQVKLRDLGYYSGDVNGVFGPASRSALRDFKTMSGLPHNDRWDRETEQVLSSGQAVRASTTFIGAWAQSIEACQTGGGARLVIRPSGASTDDGKCDFRSVRRETATTWRIQAACSAQERMWRANISLKLTASNLSWTSERGADTYTRCP